MFALLLETLRLGLQNLRLHPLRTALTSLGIILGVAAVIIMVSIGEGNKQAALRDIQALGATNIIVRSSRPPDQMTSSSQERSAFMVRYGITRQDFRRLSSAMTDAVDVVPLKAVGSEVSFGANRMTSQVFGTTPRLLGVANLRLDRGRYLSDEDLRAGAPVAVIGSQVAAQFFRLSDPLGATLRVDQQVFRVIGVLRPVGLAGGAGSALVGRDLNSDVHIPLSAAQQQFGDQINRRTAGSFTNEHVELSEVYVTAASTEAVLNAADRVKRLMDVGHARMNDVQLIVPWELLETQKKTQMVWNIVLTAIAAISLLVGGIGIMNIMLASVTERTREIGIRRALGATRRHIVYQFLVETGTLSAAGGLMGIALGVALSLAIARVLPWLLNLPLLKEYFQTQVRFETQVTPWSIIVSFVVAAFVGIAFGIYPALTASRKDPVVALRHD